jgi:hypothetical protein
MRRHLTHSHDKAMTDHFADGTAHPAQPRAAALPVVEPFIGPSFAANHSPAPITANSSAMRQSGDIGLPDKQARHPQDDGVSCVYDG